MFFFLYLTVFGLGNACVVTTISELLTLCQISEITCFVDLFTSDSCNLLEKGLCSSLINKNVYIFLFKKLYLF